MEWFRGQTHFCWLSFLANRKIDAIYTFPNNCILTMANLHEVAAAVAAVAARELQQPPTRRLQFGLVWLSRARGKELRSLE